MADVEIVIKIPEEEYEYCKTWELMSPIAKAIVNGTPFNECFGEICALKNEPPEQNVGMCQQDVGEISEKQTDGEWIEVIDEIDSLGNKTWHYECSICGNSDSGWGDYKFCPNCGSKMKGEQ